jgi:hypothetical protein
VALTPEDERSYIAGLENQGVTQVRSDIEHGRSPPRYVHSAGEIVHECLVDRRALELEVIEILGERQLGGSELILDRARLLLVDLGGVAFDGGAMTSSKAAFMPKSLSSPMRSKSSRFIEACLPSLNFSVGRACLLLISVRSQEPDPDRWNASSLSRYRRGCEFIHVRYSGIAKRMHKQPKKFSLCDKMPEGPRLCQQCILTMTHRWVGHDD